MPIVFDAASTTATSATLETRTSLTVSNGGFLLVFAASFTVLQISAMAANGVALTRLNTAGNSLEVWALTAPAAGVLSLSCQCQNTNARVVTALSYLNVKSVGPTGTVVSATAASASNMNLSVSSTVTGVVVTAFNTNGPDGITLWGVTDRGGAGLNDDTQLTGASLRTGDATGKATFSASASAPAAYAWTALGVPLNFSAGPQVLSRRALTGAGR